MARRVTVYCLVTNTDQLRNHFYASKNAANAARAEFLREDDTDEEQVWIEDVEVELSRAGVAEQLNWLVTALCANE